MWIGDKQKTTVIFETTIYSEFEFEFLSTPIGSLSAVCVVVSPLRLLLLLNSRPKVSLQKICNTTATGMSTFRREGASDRALKALTQVADSTGLQLQQLIVDHLDWHWLGKQLHSTQVPVGRSHLPDFFVVQLMTITSVVAVGEKKRQVDSFGREGVDYEFLKHYYLFFISMIQMGKIVLQLLCVQFWMGKNIFIVCMIHFYYYE